MRVRDLKCFKQVADVIGEKGALIHLGIVVNCTDADFDDVAEIDAAFYWHDTPQGRDFWLSIYNGKKPHYKWNWKTNEAEVQPY